MDEILQFDFTMEHIPGLDNHLPDQLSRFYDEDPREEPDRRYTLATLQVQEQESLTSANIPDAVYSEELDALEVENNRKMQTTLLRQAHLRGHLGAADMARLIRSSKRVNWPNLIRDAQAVVAACLPCQRYNIGKHGYHPPKSVTALLPFDHVAVDLKAMPVSSRNNHYYLVLIDVATRFVFLRSLPDKTMYSIARVLLQIFCDVGFPKILQTDNGAEFANAILAALKSLAGVDGRHIAPYHHRANGMVERAVGTTSNAIFKSLEGLVHQWDDYLPTIQYYFNTRVLELHGSSPYALLFARQPAEWINYRDVTLRPETDEQRRHRLLFLNSIVFPTILEKVRGKLKKRNDYFLKTNRILRGDYPAGAQVMIKDELRTSKAEPRYEGPFTVVRRQASGNYLLKAVDGTEYVRPANVLKLVAPEIVKDLQLRDTIYAAVDRILEHKDEAGIRRYRVRWKDTSADMDSWLTHADFLDYGPVIAYEKQLTNPKKGSTQSQRTADPPRSLPKPSQSVQFLAPSQATHTSAPSAQVPVSLNLDTDQLEAVGPYWQTRSAKRRRAETIVESDEE